MTKRLHSDKDDGWRWALDYNAFIRICRIPVCSTRGRRSLVFPWIGDADEERENSIWISWSRYEFYLSVWRESFLRGAKTRREICSSCVMRPIALSKIPINASANRIWCDLIRICAEILPLWYNRHVQMQLCIRTQYIVYRIRRTYACVTERIRR